MARDPFQIIAGPATVFVAPIGESFPAIDLVPPGGNWVSLGNTEGGVEVAHNETIEEIRTDQSSGPVKLIRTEESLVITFSLADLTLENFARALNNVTVTDTAAAMGVAGHRAIDLRQGFDVACVAMLVRGPSPYIDALLQYEVPIIGQTGSPTVAFVRDDKSILESEWTVVEDPGASTDAQKFGILRAQDAIPL